MKQNLRKPSHFIWKAIALLGFLILAFGLAIPALADYLGPDRTRTVTEIVRTGMVEGQTCMFSGGDWRYVVTDIYQCNDSSQPWLTEYPDYYALCNSSHDGTPVWHEECTDTVVTRVVTYPPATIFGSVQCSLYGNEGWCTGAASLSLSGNEPVAGYNILLLEGTRNGTSFACPGSSCSVLLLEGQNDFTFWALSSWGDSSLMGSASGKVDTQPPVINGSLNGTTGEDGWFVSSVILTASASDPAPGSGLSAFEYALDGGGWTACAGGITLADGSHTVNLRAADIAGNTSTASQSVHVDAQPPQVSLTGNSIFCPACGESLAVAYSAQDNISGISSWSLSSGGAILASGNDAASAAFNWDGGGFPAGAHTLTLHASDRAGNAIEVNLDVTLLAPTPTPTFTPLPPRPVSPTATAYLPYIPPSPTATPTVSPTPLPTFTRTPTRTPSVFIFGGTPTQVGGVAPSNPDARPAPDPDPQPNIFWGTAVAAAIGAATAYALEQRRKRKEEEAREQAKAREEVARRDAEREAARVRNWLAAEAARKEAAEQKETTATVDDVPENEEEAWREKKMAQDKMMCGKGNAATRSAGGGKPRLSVVPQTPTPDKDLDSATRSYRAWAEVIENGKFDKQAYSQAMEALRRKSLSPEGTPPLAFTPTPYPTVMPTLTVTPTPTIQPTITLKGRPLELKRWTEQAGRSTAEFCGAVLQRESHGAWQDDHWFDGRDGDPGKIFTEAAVRWYWSWIKDSGIRAIYHHNPDNPADRELMVYNWIPAAMQSEDNITQPLLEQYFQELNPNFVSVCSEILSSSKPEWAKGDGMWSWANAYLYDAEGREIATKSHLYQYGSGCTTWYIFDAATVRLLATHHIQTPDCGE